MGLIVDPGSPITVIARPAEGSVVQGPTLISATATDYFGVTGVEFEVSGQGLQDQVVSQAKAYPYGWLGSWPTTDVPDGQYTLRSIAFNPAGRSTRSAGIEVTVHNH